MCAAEPKTTPPALHSRYNPRLEASRYLDAVSLPLKPKCIVVTEPGESFLAEELRKRYPSAKICALRYQDAFYRESDALWDFCWRPGARIPPGKFLLGIIPDEHISLTAFLPWKASEKFWPAAAEYVWREIASHIRLQQSVIHTRATFGRKWLKNIFRNITQTENIASCPEISKPPLVIAPGPQLERIPRETVSALPSLFFLCALSSASDFLTSRGVAPDMCIATDGGYWAGRVFRLNGHAVPVAFPLEAYVPTDVLHENPCVLLHYGGAIEKELFAMTGIHAEAAERNGTVAGTAASFFLRKTTAPVYALGLDLSAGPGFSHARPHPFSPDARGGHFRLSPLETESAGENINSAFTVYREWFKNMKGETARRFFRLQCDETPPQDLGDIKTVPLRRAIQQIERDFNRVENPPGARADGARHGMAADGGTSALAAAERKKKTAEWLFSMAEKIERMPPDDFDSERTPAEMVKLYAYKDYLAVLKAYAEGDGDAEERMRELCGRTARYAAVLGKESANDAEPV